MIELKDNNGKLLPEKVQKRVNEFIDNLPKVSWFKPKKDLKKEDIDKQIKFALKCFGIEAEIEYRKLATPKDWASALDSARDSDWDSARDSARDSDCDSALDSARDSAWDSAFDSAWNSAWDSAFDSALDSARDSARVSARASAWASIEILLEDNKQFKSKYPNGAFKQLFKIWEMGLYPVGVLEENKKFVVYVPAVSMEFPDELV